MSFHRTMKEKYQIPFLDKKGNEILESIKSRQSKKQTGKGRKIDIGETLAAKTGKRYFTGVGQMFHAVGFGRINIPAVGFWTKDKDEKVRLMREGRHS